MNYICNRTFTTEAGKTYNRNEKISWHEFDQLEEHEQLNFSHNKALLETQDRIPSIPVRGKWGCRIPISTYFINILLTHE